MRSLDFSSFHTLVTTLLSLAIITILGVGLRLLTQVTIQQRRERVNRQINERLRALIAAYKTLSGSFTGDLTVNPAHRRNRGQHIEIPTTAATDTLDLSAADLPGADRARRIRDTVEAALSDIILLGTAEQVHLAAKAAQELASGQLIHTQQLVVSLRSFIREALDLEPIPKGLIIPQQGPARPGASGGKDKGEKGEGRSGGTGGGGGMMSGGMGSGMGLGAGSHHGTSDEENNDDSSLHHS